MVLAYNKYTYLSGDGLLSFDILYNNQMFAKLLWCMLHCDTNIVIPSKHAKLKNHLIMSKYVVYIYN